MSSDADTREEGGEPLPLVAPANELPLTAPLSWLRSGWEDIKKAPLPSLSYGVMLVLFSWLVTYLVVSTGNHILLFSLLTGFVLVGPVLAFSLYDISCQIGKGKKPSMGHCILQSRKHLGNEFLFAVVLVIILLVWARAASMIHVFFPTDGDPSLVQLATFLGVGSAVGAVFAAFVFAVSAFSLPMMMDRKVDVVTAMLTSINAVLRNKGTMLVWAALIVGLTALGFATAFIGMAVLMPLIGHATWHGYRDAIKSDMFPVSESV